MAFGISAAGAALIGAGVGAAATIYTGNKAASAQRHATDSANELAQYEYDTTRQDNMPALESRNWALEQLKKRLGDGTYSSSLTPAKVMAEPGYQFGLSQGMDALNNQYAARGMRNSGAALKAATRYGNDYATTKFDNAFQRDQTERNNDFNRYTTLAGLGSAGAQTIAAAGQNYASTVGSNTMALGNALGANYIAGGNALTSAANGINGWYQNMDRTTQIPGFYGNAVTGYTHTDPNSVGPFPG